ncbi:MAG: WD40/YVTN/BNR-like repeat-containing protein, partial [Gemmatimonadota bacterium]
MHTRFSPAFPSLAPTLLCALLALLALVTLPAVSGRAFAQQDDDGSADPLARALSDLEPREIGPAIMGGRVSDLAVDESDPTTFYVGFATAGVWKTTNQGMTFEPLFDHQPVSSIGAVSLAPSNPKIVWVGTGEPQNRNSSPYGAGVFKSMDGGESWEFMGLEETRHVARIVVHPTDPDVVYIASPGHLWGPNEERGVFRTTDGGETWEKILYIDENTGAIDLVMHPSDPNTLFAAMYQRRRTPWGFSADGDGSGIYRTLDGGESWEELTNGLPEGYKGRIGLDIYRRDGDLVYALVEARGEERGLYRSTDRGETWEQVGDRNPRPMYFSLVRIDPNDPERIYLGGVSLSASSDGGRTWHEGDAADGIHVDHHAFWIDPNDSDHLITGNDGGVATSWDRGESWRHHNTMALGQFYQIG